MKKSTKLITTAVAMVLVLGVMVVGILAATQASATIGATVSWTAEAGLYFSIDVGSVYSKEHYDLAGGFEIIDELHPNGYTTLGPESIVPDTLNQIAYIDKSTTNTEASNVSYEFDATFIDDSDDGVNNPRKMYLVYVFGRPGISEAPLFDVAITQIPTSSGNITVKYTTHNYESSDNSITFSETVPTKLPDDTGYARSLMIELSLNNPDQSVSDFPLDVEFSITKA